MTIPPLVGMGRVIVRTSDTRISGFDANTGERLWHFQGQVPSLTLNTFNGLAWAPAGILSGQNELEGGRKMAQTNCESCMNYEYDEEYDYYVCMKNLDEDEMYRFVRGEFRDCPYYQFGDEYQIVRKQM